MLGLKWAALFVVMALGAVQIQEPPEYPSGVYCSPHGDIAFGRQTTDHPCACKNMVMPDKDGCCETRITNDSTCQQWCHEAHCACPRQCVTPDHPPN